MIAKIADKIQDWNTAQARIKTWKAAGERIIFTNGCFDILHYGHLHYLAEARALGDRLVVGLNSAESVRRLKGAHRPINDEKTREFSLAALEFIDLVVPFPQDTPLELINCLIPDILVKGGDYEVATIVGAKAVLAAGGEVKTLPFIPGYSTSAIEQKIKNS
ncbi:MAG: hypothetical protein DHS20C18_05430 [Saprospiraceae bacterium]|nr:MAG: hypothetical protein DHS20C18_05430 [Saprospiraceae bacterium]